ncbi:MAG: class I SAM-dependent methyltransferase [Sneathiella sp.]|nr:class I SAM-dependent methyltransferase [Sneathiella sp.]
MELPGTKGYAEMLDQRIIRYEQLAFREVHSVVLDLIPAVPGHVLEIGAGTGRDAAALADMGHRVTAVEPTDEPRAAAERLHPSPQIDWIDDGLPDLARVVELGAQFDLVMMTAVWMHLDEKERARAMPRIASLIRPQGLLLLLLRHGPLPGDRRMFDVSAEETTGLAMAERLFPIRNIQRESVQEGNRREGITWTSLAFRKVG